LRDALAVVGKDLDDRPVDEDAKLESAARPHFKRCPLNADVVTAFSCVWPTRSVPNVLVQAGPGNVEDKLAGAGLVGNDGLLLALRRTTDFKAYLRSTSRIDLQFEFQAIARDVLQHYFGAIGKTDILARADLCAAVRFPRSA